LSQRPVNTIVYLVFGEGPQTNELVHAVLSARHSLGSDRDAYRIAVYTDRPQSIAGLDVHVEALSAPTLAEWFGPFNFIYRSKVFAMRDALSRFGGRIIYCDADTYFIAHPRRLFDRIRPGHTVMYNREGSPQSLRIPELTRVLEGHDFRTRDGQRWDISPQTVISNAGIIGLHESDVPLLDDVLHLIDQICPHLEYFGTEQFAFSACLSGRTTLTHAEDVVHHYWHPGVRAPFNAVLSRVLHDQTIDTWDERFKRIHRVRERILQRPETLQRRAYVALWRLSARLGLLAPLQRTWRGLRRHSIKLFGVDLGLNLLAQVFEGLLASV
jgi:hypothetical protein